MTIKITERRKRSDSTQAAIQATQNVALGPLEPPSCVTLRAQDKPFWEAVVTARARHTWNESDLVTAANLARTQADIEVLQKQVDEQGYIVDGKVNPAASMVEKLTNRVVTLSRILHCHAEATLGRAADSAKQATLQREAQQNDDDLIPTLQAVK